MIGKQQLTTSDPIFYAGSVQLTTSDLSIFYAIELTTSDLSIFYA